MKFPSSDRPSSSDSPTHSRLPLIVPVRRMVNLAGKFNVVRLGATPYPWRELYHLLLTLSWPAFLGVTGLFYLLSNAGFAMLYLATGDGIANATPGSFGDAFFFSVQTMSSIGFGAMHPQTLAANLLVTIESLIGLLGLATGTGLMYARFSRPTARLLFSQVAVIAPFQEIPTLMFRAANQRHNQILEAQVKLTLVRNEITPQGKFMRRFYDLPLVRSQSPIFPLTWTVMHPINEESPLFKMTPTDLIETEAELVVTLSGTDETIAQTIYARHSYIPSELRWNMQFVDILTRTSEGDRAIDYRRFHDVEPLHQED